MHKDPPPYLLLTCDYTGIVDMLGLVQRGAEEPDEIKPIVQKLGTYLYSRKYVFVTDFPYSARGSDTTSGDPLPASAVQVCCITLRCLHVAKSHSSGTRCKVLGRHVSTLSVYCFRGLAAGCGVQVRTGAEDACCPSCLGQDKQAGLLSARHYAAWSHVRTLCLIWMRLYYLCVGVDSARVHELMQV